MRNGIESIQKRKVFYNLVSSDVNNDRMQVFDNLGVATIYFDDVNQIVLGISQDGDYVFVEKNRIYILNNKKKYLYCAKLVEVQFELIEKQIEDKYNEILTANNYNVLELFPIFQIVEFVFCNLINDYWFELSWRWYHNLNSFDKKQLLKALYDIEKNKKISQKNRQIVKKEIQRVLNCERNDI